MLFNDDPMREELRTLATPRHKAHSPYEGLVPAADTEFDDEDVGLAHLGVEAAWPDPER